MRFNVCCVTLAMTLCACAVIETSESEVAQAGTQQQGQELQGQELQGQELQGMKLQGVRVGGATLNGSPLTNVHVERGEVVGQRGATILRGTALKDAQFKAQVRDTTANPPRAAVVDYRITDVVAEASKYDPTHTGNTFVYTLEQRDPDDNIWKAACPADQDGRRVAIPLAAIWDEHGDRIESNSMFTFGCTTGVIAKCYRWGYRPWLTGYGDMVSVHWSCTRMARGDYCGIGKPHTRNNTKINIWDRLPSPGPIQTHGFLPPPLYFFEAGWDTHGAVCMSTPRWLLDDGLEIHNLCPDRLIPPGLLLPTVCDTVATALLFGPEAKLFNEAFLLNL